MLNEYANAENLNKLAYTITGVYLDVMQYEKKLLNEYRKNMVAAKKYMKLVYDNSCSEKERYFLKEEMDRVISKPNVSKKPKKVL